MQVKCIHSDLKTVLHVDGKTIKGTEESDKLCHYCKESSTMVLYIAPHNKKLQANMNPFFKDLAHCINKMINNDIKNPLPIAAIFECEPAEIPRTLTKEHIAEYSVDDHKLTRENSPGSTVSWDKLSSKDYLIILNFDAGEPVYYLKEDGSIIYAIVLGSVHTDQQSIHQFLRPTVTIRVSEPENNDQSNCEDGPKTSSNGDDDQCSSSEDSGSDMVTSDNSSDDYDDNCNDHPDTDKGVLDESTITVSPIYIFKLLTVSQRKALWKGDITPFACPLVLPEIPFDKPALFNEWLHDVYTSEIMQSHSGLTLEVLRLRVMKNIVYQLRVDRNEPLLLKTLILKIQDLAQEDIPSYSPKPNGENDEIMNLLSDLMDRLCLDDVNDDDEQIDDSNSKLKLSKLIDEQNQRCCTQHYHKSRFSTPYYAKSAPVRRGQSPTQCDYSRQSVSSTTTPKVQGASSSSQPQTTSSRSWATSYSTSTFQLGYQASYSRRNWRQSVVTCSAPMKSQPSTCMKSATAWLEQAKADFNAAGSLLPTLDSPKQHESSQDSDVAMETSDGVCNKKCNFPALVCFLCHDTVEKCIKGVLYAFCGLGQNLVNCSNLIMLHDALSSSPHHPDDESLMSSIKECVMTVNRHENRSRYPNYQNPPCAPATTYDTEDAVEALAAAEKLLHKLQSEEKFQNVLQNLCQLPSRKFLSSLKSMSANEGESVAATKSR